MPGGAAQKCIRIARAPLQRDRVFVREAPAHDEAGIAKVPGQADSAPANFRPGRVALRATGLAALLCGLYVANYAYGWVTVEDLDLLGPPPG